MNENNYIFYGVDVGKTNLDIYNTNTNDYITIKNDNKAIASFLSKIPPDNNIVFIIDLTGGYEVELRDLVYKSNFKIVLAEGFKIKNFSKSILHNKAKTDKADAKLLTQYAQHFIDNLKFYKPISKTQENLKQLYNIYENLKDTLQRNKNKLKQPNLNEVCKASITRQIDFIKAEIQILKDELKTFIKQDKEIDLLYNTIINQDCYGEETALFLIANLHELGKLQRKQLTSICGLAPLPHDSGKTKKHRYVVGGRYKIKSKLYLIAMNSLRFNEKSKKILKAYTERGKPKKTIIIAIARKQIIILNAIIREKLKEIA